MLEERKIVRILQAKVKAGTHDNRDLANLKAFMGRTFIKYAIKNGIDPDSVGKLGKAAPVTWR